LLLTKVLSIRSDLVQGLDEVWEVIAEEFRSNDNALAGVVGEKCRTEKFGLALKTEC